MCKFSGIVFLINRVSAMPPKGSSGRQIVITPNCANMALEMLPGKYLYATNDFFGHIDRDLMDSERAIGIIEKTEIVGDMFAIHGFLFINKLRAAALIDICASSITMGLSFDAHNCLCEDYTHLEILTINAAKFVGVHVLYQNTACFRENTLFWLE